MTATRSKKGNGWGGRRPGAGRKPGSRQPLSVRQVQEFRAAAQQRAEQEGKTLGDIVLDIAYAPSESVRNRLAAVKLYWDKMLIKVEEGGETDRVLGPAIYLPEHRPAVVKLDSQPSN